MATASILMGPSHQASSSFTISQDPFITKNSFKSIFKRDYPPWEINGRPTAIEPPHPAEVLHKDGTGLGDKMSETSKAYKYSPLPKPLLTDAPEKLRKTNFKMDRDLNKFDSFHTSHSIDFYPKEGGEFTRGQSNDDPMRSFIPQGDPQKAPLPISDYRDCYLGHDACNARAKQADCNHQGGPATITGDERLHHFDTTHNSKFTGSFLPKLNPYPAPTGTNIPQGDKDKEVAMKTIQQLSFPHHPLARSSGYNKNSVMGELGRTNFTQRDGQGTWESYQSTAADSYRPKLGEVSRSAPTQHRNHSDFPEGDLHPYRVANRVNMTTAMCHYGSPGPTKPANIVSGADKRTNSNVWFGEPRLGENFYERTTDSTFRPLYTPYKYTRYDFNTRSTVPLDYYKNEKYAPTTCTDFQDPRQGQLVPNPTAIENLKRSHIMPPLNGDCHFSTEHLEQYTPKMVPRCEVDSGRLQYSTVPLGTLHQ